MCVCLSVLTVVAFDYAERWVVFLVFGEDIRGKVRFTEVCKPLIGDFGGKLDIWFALQVC